MSRVFTHHAVFLVEPGGLRVIRMYGTTVAGLRERIGLPLRE